MPQFGLNLRKPNLNISGDGTRTNRSTVLKSKDLPQLKLGVEKEKQLLLERQKYLFDTPLFRSQGPKLRKGSTGFSLRSHSHCENTEDEQLNSYRKYLACSEIKKSSVKSPSQQNSEQPSESKAFKWITPKERKALLLQVFYTSDLLILTYTSRVFITLTIAIQKEIEEVLPHPSGKQPQLKSTD